MKASSGILAVVIAASSALSGCASYLTTFSSDVANPNENKIYRGTREYIRSINYEPSAGAQRKSGWVVAAICALDCIPTLALDTILLPYTIPISIANALAEEK